MIVQTVTESMFIEAFRTMDRMDNFSYDGLKALFNFLEDLSEDTGESIELDIIGICCDFTELSFDLVQQEYDIDIEDCEDDRSSEEGRLEDKIEAILEYLDNETMVVWYDDEKVLFQVF